MPFRKPQPIEIDPCVKALTPKQVEKDADEFKCLLDSLVSEQTLHEFLAYHSYFFNGIIRLSGVSPLYSKIRLGSEFEVDFACFDTGSFGPEWHLIEIEGPGQPIFTRSGDPSARLTHAIRQAQDWQSWVHDNLEYARKLLPYIEYPLGYVFIGRRHELTPLTSKRLRRLNYEYHLSLEVHSLDWFISAARSVINLVERAGRGDWSLPMKALNHHNLSAGLPPLAQEYINSFFLSSAARLYPEEFVNYRQWKYEDSGGADGAESI